MEQVEMELSAIIEIFLEESGTFKPYKSILTEGTWKAFWGALQPLFFYAKGKLCKQLCKDRSNIMKLPVSFKKAIFNI